MKKEIIAVMSIFALLIIHTFFWAWFCWMWNVTPDNGVILVLAILNLLMMIMATAYFSQKYE